MTTTPVTRALDVGRASPASGAIPFSRLVRVEATKATDTRSARWLLALSAVATTGVMLAPVLAPASFDQTHAGYLRVAALAVTIPLPVVALLLFTGEWSHRSILTTFTQEPRRLRVLYAKLVVASMLGGGGAFFGGAVAAAGAGLAAASGRTVTADLSVGVLAGHLIFVLLNVFAAVALGVLLQSSASAIAASFALPMTVAVLGTASTVISDWIDMASTWNRVLENDWAGHSVQIAWSVTFWVIAPLAAGAIRLLRRDVG